MRFNFFAFEKKLFICKLSLIFIFLYFTHEDLPSAKLCLVLLLSIVICAIYDKIKRKN